MSAPDNIEIDLSSQSVPETRIDRLWWTPWAAAVILVTVSLMLLGCGAILEPGADFAGQDYGPRAFLNVHWGDGSATPYDKFWDTSAYQMNDQ